MFVEVEVDRLAHVEKVRRVFLNGEEIHVTEVSVLDKANDLSLITLTFFGRVVRRDVVLVQRTDGGGG